MVSEFRFITEWQIDAPLEQVYDAIIHCLDWPTWWQGVERVEKLASGDADGIGSVHRFTWKGRIPYRLTFDMKVTGVVSRAVLEGQAEGEVMGSGRWDFSRKDAATIVRYRWQVRTNRCWMNWLAPCAAPVFKWNHHQVMRQGAEGMSRLLNARLLSFHATTDAVKPDNYQASA
ncbi:MAG: SRPBCC family protein [Gammaproteobacteria bacterium]|nr:MAG: SRPBCC family protein [Gammaproteobacteria bacterium]